MRQVGNIPLWIGHVGDARDLRKVLATGIMAMVDVAANEPPILVNRDQVYCRFPLLDSGENPPWLVQSAIDMVAGLIRARIPTLVYCSVGLSRSPVVAAGAIAQIERCAFADALEKVVGTGPADVLPALVLEVESVLSRSSHEPRS